MAAGKTKNTESATREVFVVYEEALKAFHGTKYTNALKLFGKIEEGFPEETEVLARIKSFRKICERQLANNQKGGLEGETAEAIFDLGVYYHNNGDFEKALELYAQALSKSKGNTDHVHYAVAATLSRQGNAAKAVESLKKAVAANSNCRFHASHDPDFGPIADDPGFRSIVGDA